MTQNYFYYNFLLSLTDQIKLWMPDKDNNIGDRFCDLGLDLFTEEGFEIVFNLYYHRLLHVANHYVSQQEDAEEIVQEVFVKLWDKRKKLEIDSNNIHGYLFKMVKNRCLDHLRKRSRNLSLYGNPGQIEDFLNFKALSDQQASNIIADELKEQIIRAIDLLPERCKMIFLKSRAEDLTYRDISSELQISVKTVENQIGKALRHMRFHLQEYLHLF